MLSTPATDSAFVIPKILELICGSPAAKSTGGLETFAAAPDSVLPDILDVIVIPVLVSPTKFCALFPVPVISIAVPPEVAASLKVSSALSLIKYVVPSANPAMTVPPPALYVTSCVST